MQTLADYLQYMQTDDILAATEKAKEKSRILLEDQGIAVIALIFSDLLVDLVRQGTADGGITSQEEERNEHSI